MTVKAKKTKCQPMNVRETWRLNSAQLRNGESTAETGAALMEATDTSEERVLESRRECAERSNMTPKARQ